MRVVDAAGQAEELRANIMISAVGLLNMPKMPAIKGLDSFDGPCFHTARWPEGLELKGKRVAVIGNGASSMQIVPAIAAEVAELTVFQRSKQWAAPFERFQKPVPADARFLLKELPFYQEWYRQRLAWVFNDRIHSSLQIDPEWPHPERAINRHNDKHREYFTKYIQRELGDRQDLLPDLLPDYPPFGKRMLMDNGWYRTMTRDNVHLVNEGIAEVSGKEVVTNRWPAARGRCADRRHRLRRDQSAVLVQALRPRRPLDPRGLGRQRCPRPSMGVATPGFPNFFMLAGPNTALGHGGSVVALLETQVRYVMGLMKQVLAQQAGRFEIEVREDVHRAYNLRVQAAHERMIWTHKGMSNWYRNCPGQGGGADAIPQ